MWPFKKRKKQVTPSVGGVAPVIIINDGKLIHDIMGITEERALALYNELERVIAKENCTVKVMAEYSKFCLHQNEFAFGCYIMRDITNKLAMAHAFKDIFGKH